MELNQFIQAIKDSHINQLALVIILFLMLLALFGKRFCPEKFKEKLKHYSKQAPSILATVGIFFSFLGISLALLNFDQNNLAESTPKLLDGLKVKFIASLMGIFASIIVRFAQSFSIEEEQTQINVDDKIVNLLSEIHQVLAKNANNSPEELLQGLKQSIDELPAEFRKQTALLESVRNSLAGEGDASVTTQLKLVRSDIKDDLKLLDANNKQRSETLNHTLNSNFAVLTQEFENFAKIVAENNSKAFIEALEAAMRDFNNNITEQFGENFKQLNQAVGELLKWQENYKTHVEQMTEKFDIALKSVVEIQNAFSQVVTQSGNFVHVSDELKAVLEKLDVQLQSFDTYLKGIRLIADNAKESFPIIEENLNKLTTGFRKSTEQSLADINNTVESVGENLVETTTRLKDTTGKLRDSMENQRETLERTSDEFKGVVDVTLKSLAKDTKASIENYQESLQEVVTTQLDNINSSVQKSNSLVNTTIQNASTEFEKSISDTGATLKATTNEVAAHLTSATNSMSSMIETQQNALTSTSDNFKAVVSDTLRDLSKETQASIENYQTSLQKAVTEQLDSIDSNIKRSNAVIDTTIRNSSEYLENTVKTQANSMNQSIATASDTFKEVIQNTATELESSITVIGSTLENTTKNVSQHIEQAGSQLSTSTTTMRKMIETQTDTLNDASANFKAVVSDTLRDLSKETQASIENYQVSLQEVVKLQLNSIDDSIKETHSVVNKTIKDVGAEFENAIKVQSESMNKTIATAGDSFKVVVQDTAKEFEKMAESIAESIFDQEKILKNVSQDVKIAVDKTLRDLTEQSKLTMKEYETSLHNIIMSQFNTVKEAVTTASKEFNRLLADNTEKSTSALMQQTQLLDKALQEELKKAIETMGKHLAALSNQFVQDYRPLTEKLREVVELAENLKRGGR